MRGLLLRACFVRCARAGSRGGSCGGVNDPHVVDAQRELDEAEASNEPIDIKEAATALKKAKEQRKKTSRRKRKAGRLATHM